MPRLDDERTQLAAFASRDEADVDVSISAGYVPASRPGGFRLLDSTFEEADQSVHMWTTDWSASCHLDEARTEASLGLLRPLVLDSLLRSVAQVFALSQAKGVYMHASSVVRDGEGFVFAGVSGAGKTTAAELSRQVGCEVVDEELTCVSFRGPQAALCGTPFFQKSGFHGRPLQVPLRGIYVLRQATRDEVTSLPAPQALASVVRCVSIGVRQPPLIAAGLRAAEELLRRVPVRLLYFRKAPSFWDAIIDDVRSS